MMYQLCVKLPPFSPDYSGVCSALFQLGGLMVIHDASGCTGNYTGYDEPRFYGSRSLVYCSGLRELDAVMGNDDKFVRRVKQAAEELNPNFICFLGSPVPMVIGTDLQGIAKEIEQETKIPSFGFSTTGLHYYNKGIADAWIVFSKRFLLPKGNLPKIPNGINILGLNPLDFSANDNALEIIQTFNQMGFEVISDFAMHSSFEQIQNAAAAKANVVVSESGIALAKWFYQEFGIPYVVGAPIGTYCSNKMLELVNSAMEDGTNKILESGVDQEQNILILHDEVVANSLKTCLVEEYGLTGVKAASSFVRNSIEYQEKTLSAQSEKEITKLLNEGGFHTIIADPLMQDLIKSEEIRLIDFPHVAVSSKIHWDDYVMFCSTKIDQFIKERGIISL